MKTSRRIREPKLHRLAKSIDMPQAQIDRGDYEACDVANRTDAEQRHSVRSQQTRTVRKKTKLQKLCPSVITKDELKTCEWYQGVYSLAYEMLGTTADYGRPGGNGFDPSVVMMRSRVQRLAASDYAYARAGIDPLLVGLFERIVLHGRPMNRLGLSFRRAVRQLAERVQHVEIAA